MEWRGPWGPGMGPRATSFAPQRHLAMAWRRRRQAMWPPSNSERQVTGNVQ